MPLSKAFTGSQPGGFPVTLPNGQVVFLPAVVSVAESGGASGPTPATYLLAGSPLASLAAGATTQPVTIPAGQSASYGWATTMTGTSPSLAIEAVSADGATYFTVATITAPGTTPVVIFTGSGGATVRLRNTGANPITALTSSLSN